MGDLENPDRIVLFGDSITQQSFTPELLGFGTRLSNDYARRMDVINRGFSGYTTNQALKLLPRIFPCRRDNVKLITVFFGANDSALPGEPQHVAIIRFKDNVKSILTSEQLRGKVLVMTAPPLDNYGHDPVFGTTRTAEHTKLYRDATLELCAELKVPCVDVWLHMMNQVGWEKSEHLPGSLNRPQHEQLSACFHDGLHPTKFGYEMIYNALVNGIQEHFPQLMPQEIDMPTLYWPYAVQNPPGTVLRWHLSTSELKERYNELLSLLSTTEQQSVETFHFQKDKLLALGSLLLQKLFISEILGCPWSRIGIQRDANNRPYFKNRATRDHDYNVSHHGDHIILVGTMENGRIGVDLTIAETPTEPVSEFLHNFKDTFSAREWGTINGDLDRFYQHWALKESYVKAMGTGIVVDLPAIEFSHVEYVSQNRPYTNTAKLTVSGTPSPFKFEVYQVAEKTYMAVAMDGVSEDFKLSQINANQFVVASRE